MNLPSRSAGALSLLATLAACTARPPLPPLQAAWRETPVTPYRAEPPAALSWTTGPRWSATHALRLRNGLAVHLLQRERAATHVLLVSPSAGLESRGHDRVALATTRAALVSALASGDAGPRLDASASVSDLGTLLSVTGPQGSLRPLAARLSASLSPAGIPDAALARARDQLSLRRRDDVGLAEAMEIALLQQLFGEDSAAARPSVGYSDELRAVTLPTARRALLSAYATRDAALVVVCDMAPEEVQRILDDTLGALTLSPPAESDRAYGTFPPEQQPVVLVPAGSPLSVLTVACPLGGSRGADLTAQRAFASVLGASLGSRLDEVLRGEHALIYDAVDAEVRNVGGQSILLIRALPAQRDVADTLRILMDQFEVMSAQGLPRDEAERAVALTLEQRVLGWDSASSVGFLVASDLLAGVAPRAPSIAPLLEVTTGHLREIAARCPARRLAIAISGTDRTLASVAQPAGRPEPRLMYWRTPQAP